MDSSHLAFARRSRRHGCQRAGRGLCLPVAVGIYRVSQQSVRCVATVVVAVVLCAAPAYAQDNDYARQVAQERREAEFEGPLLAEVLGLEPGMTVADIGTGGGAMAIVLGRLVGPGRVYATDIAPRSLTTTRDYAKREGLTNITVIEGSAASTNLPNACCEALFLRNVYHHITKPAAFDESLYATAKPGGRVAIIDSAPGKGSQLPAGVPTNRGGHGVPAMVVIDELTAAGFVHVRTIQGWPPGTSTQRSFWRCSKNASRWAAWVIGRSGPESRRRGATGNIGNKVNREHG